MTGKKVGYLNVISRAPNLRNIAAWNCRCDCGKETVVLGFNLRNGHTKSCGCFSIEIHSTRDGDHRGARNRMLDGAEQRAKQKGIRFELSCEDIPEIPDVCPVLKIPLKVNYGGRGGFNSNSPTLDRIVPQLGYVKGNVRIISWRANRLKNDATLEELKLLGADVENLINAGHKDLKTLENYRDWFMTQPLCNLRIIETRNYEALTAYVVNRMSFFQTEWVLVKPFATLPPHRHPNLDTIECHIGGDLFLGIGATPEEIQEKIDKARVIPEKVFSRIGRFMRINSTDWHGGKAGATGASFFSIQQWEQSVTPTAAGEDWLGPALK